MKLPSNGQYEQFRNCSSLINGIFVSNRLAEYSRYCSLLKWYICNGQSKHNRFFSPRINGKFEVMDSKNNLDFLVLELVINSQYILDFETIN